jgi:hypothetical protein
MPRALPTPLPTNTTAQRHQSYVHRKLSMMNCLLHRRLCLGIVYIVNHLTIAKMTLSVSMSSHVIRPPIADGLLPHQSYPTIASRHRLPRFIHTLWRPLASRYNPALPITLAQAVRCLIRSQAKTMHLRCTRRNSIGESPHWRQGFRTSILDRREDYAQRPR